MIGRIPHYSHISEEEYYVLEDRAKIRHEYLDGEIFDIASSSLEHAHLAANATATLGIRLRGHRC